MWTHGLSISFFSQWSDSTSSKPCCRVCCCDSFQTLFKVTCLLSLTCLIYVIKVLATNPRVHQTNRFRCSLIIMVVLSLTSIVHQRSVVTVSSGWARASITFWSSANQLILSAAASDHSVFRGQVAQVTLSSFEQCSLNQAPTSTPSRTCLDLQSSSPLGTLCTKTGEFSTETWCTLKLGGKHMRIKYCVHVYVHVWCTNETIPLYVLINVKLAPPLTNIYKY